MCLISSSSRDLFKAFVKGLNNKEDAAWECVQCSHFYRAIIILSDSSLIWIGLNMQYMWNLSSVLHWMGLYLTKKKSASNSLVNYDKMQSHSYQLPSSSSNSHVHWHSKCVVTTEQPLGGVCATHKYTDKKKSLDSLLLLIRFAKPRTGNKCTIHIQTCKDVQNMRRVGTLV